MKKSDITSLIQRKQEMKGFNAAVDDDDSLNDPRFSAAIQYMFKNKNGRQIQVFYMCIACAKEVKT